MKITHRAPADALAPALGAAALGPLATDKAPRLAVCCRLSELLPLVRQAHDAARAAHLDGEEQTDVAA